jgi:hypothetical protein
VLDTGLGLFWRRWLRPSVQGVDERSQAPHRVRGDGVGGARLRFPTWREYGLSCAMIGGLPCPRENGPVPPGRRIAPEWKVTLQTPEWQRAELADQPKAARPQSPKIQYQQRLVVAAPPAKPRAEGALKLPKVSKFHTPLCVNIQPRQSRDARRVLGGRIRKRMLGALARRRQTLKGSSKPQPSEPSQCA